MIDYQQLIPDDSFIGKYLSYMDIGETPIDYDFWCALWLMSIACSRDLIIARPHAPVYMNWFIILTAESGITRKSSAVRTAKDIALALQLGDDMYFELIETKMTPELLETILNGLTKQHGYARAAICVSELVSFLGRERYTRSMPALLTDLYDSPSYRSGGGTISRGRTLLQNVYVSFLSASTPSWLIRAVNPDVVEGGFTSRVMFIRNETPKRSIAWPSEQTNRTTNRAGIIRGITEIRNTARELQAITLTKLGMDAFITWYDERIHSRDAFNASFEAREDSHILRMAACLALNRQAISICEQDISPAISIIAQVKRQGADLFAGASVNSKLVAALDRIRERLIRGGVQGVQHWLLQKHVDHLGFERHVITTALNIMHELDLVEKFENVSSGTGRKATVWRATKSLRNDQAIDWILDEMSPDDA